MTHPSFYICDFYGVPLYAWLTPAEAHTPASCWDDERVDAFEDRDGEMIVQSVRLADLTPLEEC